MSFGFDGDYKEQVASIKKAVYSKLDKGFVVGKLFVWESPIAKGKLERRVAFFVDNTEADMWEVKMRETYDNLGYVYHVYDI